MEQFKETISTKPYLLRALYEWIQDNGWTPYVTINTTIDEVAVPTDKIVDNRITLDISSDATNKLRIGNDAIEFDARFSGNIYHIFLPMASVMAIFSKETGDGMPFIENPLIEDDEYTNLESVEKETSKTKSKNPSSLKIVK
jgi:stringent starvation protein B